MKAIFKICSFYFEQLTITWKPNDDKSKKPEGIDRPFKWVVYAGNSSKWFSNLAPNQTNAKRYFIKHFNK